MGEHITGIKLREQAAQLQQNVDVLQLSWIQMILVIKWIAFRVNEL